MKSFIYKGSSLPLDINPSKWGSVIAQIDNTSIIKYDDHNKFYIVEYEGYRNINLLYDDTKILSFKDEYVSSTCFIRYHDDNIFMIEDGKVIFKSIRRKVSHIPTRKVHKRLSNKFLTFDLETRLINNIMVPYCISISDGYKSWSYYLSDYKNSDEMIL